MEADDEPLPPGAEPAPPGATPAPSPAASAALGAAATYADASAAAYAGYDAAAYAAAYAGQYGAASAQQAQYDAYAAQYYAAYGTQPYNYGYQQYPGYGYGYDASAYYAAAAAAPPVSGPAPPTTEPPSSVQAAGVTGGATVAPPPAISEAVENTVTADPSASASPVEPFLPRLTTAAATDIAPAAVLQTADVTVIGPLPGPPPQSLPPAPASAAPIPMSSPGAADEIRAAAADHARRSAEAQVAQVAALELQRAHAMRMAEQAEEMRQAAETAAIAARNQEIARKAAASEARRLKMEADVQERIARERKLKEIAEAHAQSTFLTPANVESTAVAEAAERKRRTTAFTLRGATMAFTNPSNAGAPSALAPSTAQLPQPGNVLAPPPPPPPPVASSAASIPQLPARVTGAQPEVAKPNGARAGSGAKQLYLPDIPLNPTNFNSNMRPNFRGPMGRAEVQEAAAPIARSRSRSRSRARSYSRSYSRSRSRSRSARRYRSRSPSRKASLRRSYSRGADSGNEEGELGGERDWGRTEDSGRRHRSTERSPRSSSRRRHKKKSKRKRRERDAEDSVPAAAVEATAPVPAPHVEAAPAKALDSASQPSRRSLPSAKIRTRQPEVVQQSSLASNLGGAALVRVDVKAAQLPAMTAPAAAASTASAPPPPRETKRHVRRGAKASRFNAEDEESIYPEANPIRPVAATASFRQPTPLARPIAAATLRPAPPLVAAPAVTMQPLWAAQVSCATADDILDKYDDSDSDGGLGGTVIQRAPLPRTKPEIHLTDGLLAAASIMRVLPPVPAVQLPPVPLPVVREIVVEQSAVQPAVLPPAGTEVALEDAARRSASKRTHNDRRERKHKRRRHSDYPDDVSDVEGAPEGELADDFPDEELRSSKSRKHSRRRRDERRSSSKRKHRSPSPASEGELLPSQPDPIPVAMTSIHHIVQNQNDMPGPAAAHPSALFPSSANPGRVSAPGTQSAAASRGIVAGVVTYPTTVLRLGHMVLREELADEDEYDDQLEDINCEISAKYGPLKSCEVPRPAKDGPHADPPGVGLVFVEFEALADAVHAQRRLDKRSFGGRRVAASFFDESVFALRALA